MKYIVTVGNKRHIIEIKDTNEIFVNDRPITIDLESASGSNVHSMLIDGRSYLASVERTTEDWQVLLLGDLYSVNVVDERQERLAAASGGAGGASGEFKLKSPMPGLVVTVPVTEGQAVEEGDILIILESMKMQNELKSPMAGTVTKVRVKDGDSVEGSQLMVIVTAETEE